MEADLQGDGWALSDKGLEYCKAICANKKPSKKDIITNALHTDIREIGRQCLPADINKQHLSEINGPIILQVLKVKNVSAPNAKEDSSFAPRMLKLTMTDGVITCSGIEMEVINAISLSTPPGSKVCLLGTITVQHGFLLLDSKNLKFLGGEVEHLRAKWEISKNVSKMQRKVLTAEGGPPLFVPFEDSDFAKRKPQGQSVTIKHVEANVKQKGKAVQKTEKPSKPFEEKKIWKSEPFNGKKGKSQSSVKGGSDVKEKPEPRQQAPRTEANSKRSGHPSRVADGKNVDDREKNRSAFERKDDKAAGSRGGKRVDEKEKERTYGEEKRHTVESSGGTRSFKSDGSMHLGKEKDAGKTGRPGGREGYDSRGQAQQENFSHERYEKFNRRSGKYESELPPRLERLKQNVDDNVKRGFKEQKYGRDVPTKVKDPHDVNAVDEDMKQVTELINERMKFDDRNSEVRGTFKNQPPTASTFKDRNFKKTGYRQSDLNSNQTMAGSKHEEKPFDGRKDRFGSATTRDRGSEEGRGHGRADGRGRREKRHGDSNRNYSGRGRGSAAHDRGYNGGEHGGSVEKEHGGKWETGPRRNERPKYLNDSSEYRENHKDVTSDVEFSRQIDQPSLDASFSDAQVTNKQVVSTYPNNKIDVLLVTQDKEKLDKVNETMNSIINSAIPKNLMVGDPRLQQHQIPSDHSQTQAGMQPVVNLPGQFTYNYYPPYAMYHPNVQQGYQSIPNQEFRHSGYHQPPVHPMQPLSQYQQYTVATTAQDFRCVPTVSPPPPPMNFQNQGMPSAGQQTRHRAHVRHDIYRPKRN